MIFHARLVRPRTVLAAAVADAAVAVLGAADEAQVRRGQPADRVRGHGLARGQDQSPRDVIHAVPVVTPGGGEQGVLEQADLCAQARQMVETELGNHQATDRAPVWSSKRPSLTYCSATAGQSSAGARARAVAAIGAATPGSVRTRRNAAPMASGSCRATRIPAPLDSSSTACGKAVETTGSPATTASVSTPEVTWSLESYGRRITSALRTIRRKDGPSRYRPSNSTIEAIPNDWTNAFSRSRYASPSRSRTRGWVCPTTR